MSILDVIGGAGGASHFPLGRFADAAPARNASPAQTADHNANAARKIARFDEGGLIDGVRNVAKNLFAKVRDDLQAALKLGGIDADVAGQIVRDVGRSLAEAVRNGTGFSFAMVAAAYRETIVQTATTASHSLEFSASAITIDYNHVTGELTAETSSLEIDAFRYVEGGAPAMPASLFDFTDTEGFAGLPAIFESLERFLDEYGFAYEPEDEDASPDTLVEDSALVSAAPSDNGDDTVDPEQPIEIVPPQSFAQLGNAISDGGPFRLQSVEEFTNARQESITRLTFDLMFRIETGERQSAQPNASVPEERIGDGNNVSSLMV